MLSIVNHIISIIRQTYLKYFFQSCLEELKLMEIMQIQMKYKKMAELKYLHVV